MARRRHQRGCVILKGQVWYGKYRDDVVEQDGTVTRVQRRTPLGTKREYPTKRLAERKLEQILCRINAVEYRPGRVATLAEFAERWKVEIVTKYKPSTKCSAGSHVNSHILPYLGKLRMDAIGAENQQAFVTHLADQVSYKSVLNILSTLSSMLTTAKNWGYVCEGVDQHKLVLPGRGIRKDAACFTADEVRNILRIAEDPWRLMFACAALLGLRAGEILGLRVEDVDLQTRTLNIKQGAWRGKLQTAKNTASEAALPIPAALEGFFREYLKTWKPNPLGLLFCNRNGACVDFAENRRVSSLAIARRVKDQARRFSCFPARARNAAPRRWRFAKGGATPAPPFGREGDTGHLCSPRRGNAPRSS